MFRATWVCQFKRFTSQKGTLGKMKLCLIWLFIIFLLQSGASQDLKEGADDNLKCIDNFCVPMNYSKYLGPFDENGHIDILVDFDISQVVQIHDVKFTIKLLMHIGLTWVDPRIIGPESNNMTSWIPVDNEFTNYIWLPDLYIYNLKEIEFPKYYKPFSGG